MWTDIIVMIKMIEANWINIMDQLTSTNLYNYNTCQTFLLSNQYNPLYKPRLPWNYNHIFRLVYKFAPKSHSNLDRIVMIVMKEISLESQQPE